MPSHLNDTLLHTSEHGFERKQQRVWDYASNSMPRERFSKQLDKDIDGLYLSAFIGNFKLAVDDMDRQFSKIRKARNGLFIYDKYAHESEIDMKDYACSLDDLVNWEVNEPDTDVPEDLICITLANAVSSSWGVTTFKLPTSVQFQQL